MSKPTCPRCGNAKHRGRCKASTTTESAAVETAQQPEPRLTIEPGLGVDAWIENGRLQIAQGGETVALSKTEAKVLFAEFGEWAA